MIEGSSYQGKNCNKCMSKIYAGEINFSSSYQESTVFVLIWVHACPSYGYYTVHTPISKNVVGENGEWQLSNGNCTTERNCGFHINEFFAWH